MTKLVFVFASHSGSMGRVMTTRAFTMFRTAIGTCGIVWTERGISGLQLPEGHEAATRARLLRRFPGASEAVPPSAVARARDAIVALLQGERADLSFVTLDMDGVPPFARRVYEAARAIPAGSTRSYGALAAALGMPAAARAVGQALGRNPFAIVVPCHRVVAAGGKLGGFTANGGAVTKQRLLQIEGARAPALF
jgi:methylated-DNA-[protein]-cysteine S-methyltransferase